MSEENQDNVVALWLTKKEACKRLGCSSRTLNRFVQRGDIKRKQTGREAQFFITQSLQSTPEQARHTTRATPPKHEPHLSEAEPHTPQSAPHPSKAELDELQSATPHGASDVLLQLTQTQTLLTTELISLQNQALKLTQQLGQAKERVAILEAEQTNHVKTNALAIQELSKERERIQTLVSQLQLAQEKRDQVRQEHIQVLAAKEHEHIKLQEQLRLLQSAHTDLLKEVESISSSVLAWPLRKRLRTLLGPQTNI